MKRTEFDRELVGPDSYECFNNLSKLCQKRYLSIVGWQLILLLLISLIASIPVIDANCGQYEKVKHFIQLLLIFIVLILMIRQFRSNYMDGWQKTRFLAESILSQSWLLFFKIDKYDNSLNNSLQIFHDRIKSMKSEINITNYLRFLSPVSIDNDKPKWVADNFNLTNDEKIEYYIKNRLNDQELYYYKKTLYNTKKGERFFWFGLCSMGLGAILTVLTIMDLVPNFSYLGLFTTLAAAVFSWKQTKRFEELSSTYSVAIDELKDFKKKLLLSPTENRTKEIVYDVEKAISREHKMWVSKIGD